MPWPVSVTATRTCGPRRSSVMRTVPFADVNDRIRQQVPQDDAGGRVAQHAAARRIGYGLDRDALRLGSRVNHVDGLDDHPPEIDRHRLETQLPRLDA